MGWNSRRNSVVWVVQRTSTGRVLCVYDRKYAAEMYVDEHPNTHWVRRVMNQEEE